LKDTGFTCNADYFPVYHSSGKVLGCSVCDTTAANTGATAGLYKACTLTTASAGTSASPGTLTVSAITCGTAAA